MLKEAGKRKPIDPIEIWDTLDVKTGKEYIRPTQRPIFEEWHKNRHNQRDNIIKLHTGHGKTVIGLVILQSCLNEGKGPALYICPNKYLVSQTIQQAKDFGINAIEVSPSEEIPSDFLNSKAILVITCKKMFNGRSVFGIVGSRRNPVEIGALVMDDAHSCLEIMRESFSVRCPRKNPDGKENLLWKNLFNLFSDTLKKQAAGTFNDIYNGEDFILAVPFWTWTNKLNDVMRILSKEKDGQLKFEWNLIKDVLQTCTCVFSGGSLEISPRVLPIHYIPSFACAKRRFFLSATLTEDAFLIKDLNLEPISVRNPLTTEIERYSGERLFIIPRLIQSEIKRKQTIRWLSGLVKKKLDYGVVAIVPSYRHASDWESEGSTIAQTTDLYEKIEELKTKVRNKEVNSILTLVNRYDGIDLPDEFCRVLCLDSLPQYMSLYERYFQKARTDSKIQQQLLAQRIEQGVGRGVRGKTDWCIIIITGNDLVNFLASDFRLSLLSNETHEQILIGADLAEKMKVEGASINVINSLMQQCLDRNEDWKGYYRQRMQTITIKKPNEDYIEQYLTEKEAEDCFSKGLHPQAIGKVQRLIDRSKDKSDKGWYLQLMATYQYVFDRAESMSTQLKAHEENKWLFIPETGITYTRMSGGMEPKYHKIINWIKTHRNHNDVFVDLQCTLDKLCFGGLSDTFEEGINELGNILGFVTQQPEKDYGEGPDNLWNDGSFYLIIECKNYVKSEREKIFKRETGQMDNSIGWFKRFYPQLRGLPVIIHPSDVYGKGAYITSDGEAKVLLPEKLDELKNNILNFFRSLQSTSFDMLDERKINQELEKSKLTNNNIFNYYCSKIKR